MRFGEQEWSNAVAMATDDGVTVAALVRLLLVQERRRRSKAGKTPAKG